jgi:hypothetical protein
MSRSTVFGRISYLPRRAASRDYQPAVTVQRKNNWSGVSIEHCGGFAISTRSATGGPCFAFTAWLALRATSSKP